jgi:ribosome-binding protein aMBF1 (putative translation factor)
VTKPVRGGTSGRSFAPKRTIYKGKDVPPMWKEFMAANRKFREDHGLSAQALADLMGVSLSVVYAWEQGVAQPHPWDLTVYLEAIGAKKLTIE